MRTLLVLAFLFGFTGSALAEPSQAVLKAQIVVEGDKVLLGDLFDASAFTAAPEAAHVAVLAAPKPGDSLLLDALALQRFAAKQRIDWPNTQALTTIKIERAGLAVGGDAVEAALRDGLAAQGLQGRVGLRLSSVPALFVATGTPASLSVDTLTVDTATGQFQAMLRAPANDPTGTTAKVMGRAYKITELPVLTRDIKPGETIGPHDVVLTEMASEKLGQNVLTATGDIVGRAPKRMIRAGEPLRLGDVEAPVLVKKDAIVTMVMRAPGMTLTAEGRALEDGAKGDAIKVMNTNSKRTIIATVEGDGIVAVGQTGAAALASAQ
jgi:flagella basal body P-ring formation protein FlgA